MTNAKLAVPRPSRLPLSRQVYEILLGQLLEGELRPGQRLIESDLAAQLGTSRGPIREAIGLLQADGLVRVDPFQGAQVISPTPNELREIYSLRAVLEGYAANRIVVAGDGDAIARLRRITLEMRSHPNGSIRELRSLDAHFHQTLVASSAHDELLHVWRQMRAKIGLYMTDAEAVFSIASDLAAHHEEIIEAIATGDPIHTELAVRDHLIGNAERLIRREELRLPHP